MSDFTKNFNIFKIWYLSAIEIIDTQVARRGRQYHRNPPSYKNRPTKKNRIYKIKNHTTTTAAQPNPTHTTPHHPPTPPQTPNTTTPHPNPHNKNKTKRIKKYRLVKSILNKLPNTNTE